MRTKIAYDYVELTREVINDEDADHEVDMPVYQNSKSIPLMDARKFSNAQ